MQNLKFASKQAFFNFITKAIQFCPKKGPHRLFAKKLQSTGEYKELYLLKLISISIGVSDFISLLEIIAAVKRRQINEI